jgi:8-oxo-dGTP pyrophosphatase MutT (NUDIX family)
MQPLVASRNPFRGMVINSAELTTDPNLFQHQLTEALASWKNEGILVVWLEVPIAKSSLIPIAVEAGFTFHHSSEAYLMLTLRLVEDALIPNYATHYIGAGGVVLNQQRELLVVSELHRRSRDKPYYKLPGGALHPGEHLADGVMREVLEETGVETKFDGLVCFRHWHGYRYGKSDIYFVCRLSPLSSEITKQDDEIEECIWMPVDNYLNSEDVGVFNKQIVSAALNNPSMVTTWVEGYNNPDTHEFFMPGED